MLAPLYPDETGLPMTLWVGLRGGSRQDVRVVANGMRGARMTIAKPVTVAVLPTPRLVRGQLPLVHQRLVFAWAARNAAALADYWAGAIGLVGLGARLRPLPRFEVRCLARAARAEAATVGAQ
jgi:hypothetical protein